MGATGFESVQDRAQHPLSVSKNLVVPKSEHPETLTGEPAVALYVICLTLCMLSPVEFEHQLRFKTREVCYEACDWHLAPEPITSELPVPDLPPEIALGVRRLIAKNAGALLKERVTHGYNLLIAPTLTLPRTRSAQGRVSRACPSFIPATP